MGGMYNNPFERRAVAVAGAFFVLLLAGVLTSYAAPGVTDRFAASWGVASTFELDRELFSIRLARADKLAAAERKEEEVKKEIISRRGISRATIADHVPSEGKFVGIDLVEMRLSMFEDGVEVGTTTIISKGRPGSHWETPSGSYTIRTREESHFSTIGEVYMPYSMQFYGNYFIHGWPTKPNGEPVPEGYSGGCVRLSTEDSKVVFDFVRAGTPIFIYDTDALPDAPTPPLLLGDVVSPDISAKAYVIADLDAGEILAEKDADMLFPIGGLTQFMTAIVANENISYDKKISVASPPGEYASTSVIIPDGERIVIGKLYYPMLLQEGTQAAASFAEHFGEKRFLSEMNKRAKAIGMARTTLSDATGQSLENVSTVNDLILLATHLREKKRFLLNISKEEEREIDAESGAVYPIQNQSIFAGSPTYLGGKSVHIEGAGDSGMYLFRLEGAATMDTKSAEEDVRAVAIIFLGSEDGTKDMHILDEWLDTAVALGIEKKQKTAVR